MTKIALFILALFFIWFLFNYVLLILKNGAVMTAFKKLEKLLIKRYDIVSKIGVPQETGRYLEELKNLPTGTKFLNRKLALNYIVTKSINGIPQGLSDEYKIINAELFALGEDYNQKAQKLKFATEVFPTSFVARFINIKTVDFYRA